MSGIVKEWFSAAEIAGLPGLPETKSGVLFKIERERWTGRKRQGRGGGREYHITSLPPATQAHLLLRDHAKPTAQTKPAPIPSQPPLPVSAENSRPPQTETETNRQARRESLWRLYEKVSKAHKDEAARRLSIVKAVQALINQGIPMLQAREKIAAEIETSAATIYRWQKRLIGLDSGDWLPALVPDYGAGGARHAEISPEAWDYFKSDYLRLEKPAAKACYARLKQASLHNVDRETGELWKVPDLATLVRKLHREIPAGAIVLAREGREAAMRAIPAQQRDHSVFHALEAVNADGHKFDVRIEWPDGSKGRPMMISWQDVYSGKILAYRIDKTENADAIRLAFGDLVQEFGIPEIAYLDNGRAFASKWITGGSSTRYRFKIKPEDPIGVMTQMGVQTHWTTPYHGQAKPIERAFRDLCEYVAKHPAFQGCYTGNSPMNKPEDYSEGKAVPLADFLTVLETEIKAHNARLGRRSAVCDGSSFDQVFWDSYGKSVIRKATAEQRRLWLLAVEGVTASAQDGSVTLAGNRYWTEKLVQFRKKTQAARKLIVRFDPERLHAGIFIYLLDGRFVCEAECQIKAGFNDHEAAREHNRLRNQIVRNNRQILDAERRMTALEAAQMLPGVGGAEAEKEEKVKSKIVRPSFKRGQDAAVVAQPETEEVSAFDQAMENLRKGKIIPMPRVG